MKNKPEVTEVQFIDKRTGKPADMLVVEEAGVAFVHTSQHLDLSKDEKRRTTALMMSIQAYQNPTTKYIKRHY